MSDRHHNATVRIFSKNGKIAGCGFLISKRYLITCAHVIADALGFSRTYPEIPSERVTLDFPLLESKDTCTARTIGWHPIRANPITSPENIEDIAVLELEIDPPAAARPVSLIKARDFWEHDFHAFGFPKEHDYGVWSRGKLRERQASGWIQIESSLGSSYSIQQGFSGTVVWDENLDGAIGMVIAAEPSVRAALVIPTSILVQAWPELNHYVTDDIKNYLQIIKEQLFELPTYYPSDFSVERILQQFKLIEKHSDKQTEHAPNTNPLDYHEGKQRKSQKALKKDILEWSKIRDQITRAVILANPGFGKSWLLKYEGWTVACDQLERLLNGEIEENEIILPIYINLEALSEALERCDFDILEAIIRVLRAEYSLPVRFLSQVKQLLPRGQCFLLLDALDEVASNRRPRLLKAIKRLADYPCRILLTSRSAGYVGSPFPLRNDIWERELELAGFEAESIDKFIDCWFSHKNKNRDRLKERILLEDSFQSLCRIPLILSFLCLVYDQDEHISVDRYIPERRADLYERVLRLLLEAPWKESPQPQEERRIEDKLILLERIAWHFATLDNIWHDFMPSADLHKLIRIVKQEEHWIEDLSFTSDVIEELSVKDGVLVKAGESRPGIPGSQVPYLFLHRTIHEYLTAKYLVNQSADIWLFWLRENCWFNADWEEVIVLLASCLTAPNPLLETILEESNDAFHAMLFLAGRCLGECSGRMVKANIVEHIVGELLTLLYSADDGEQEEAVSVLGMLGNFAVPGLLKLRTGSFLDVLDDSLFEEILGLLEKTGIIDQFLDVLITIAKGDASDSPIRRSLAVGCLEKIGGETAISTLEAILKDKTESYNPYSSGYVRAAAAQGLAQIDCMQAISHFEVILSDEDEDAELCEELIMILARKIGELEGECKEKAQNILLRIVQNYKDKEWENYSPEDLCVAAIEALLLTRHTPTIESLLDAIPDIRILPRLDLGVEDEYAVKILLEILMDKSRNKLLRRSTAQLMTRVNVLSVWKDLIRLLLNESEDWHIRTAIAEALVHVGVLNTYGIVSALWGFASLKVDNIHPKKPAYGNAPSRIPEAYEMKETEIVANEHEDSAEINMDDLTLDSLLEILQFGYKNYGKAIQALKGKVDSSNIVQVYERLLGIWEYTINHSTSYWGPIEIYRLLHLFAPLLRQMTKNQWASWRFRLKGTTDYILEKGQKEYLDDEDIQALKKFGVSNG